MNQRENEVLEILDLFEVVSKNLMDNSSVIDLNKFLKDQKHINSTLLENLDKNFQDLGY
jgi:hypothetical protein